MWLLLTTFAVENYHLITLMYKILLLSVAVVAACLSTKAQTPATDYKGSGNSNPISANVFCADPTALEYNGRLYVYGSNDHQEFLANGHKLLVVIRAIDIHTSIIFQSRRVSTENIGTDGIVITVSLVVIS